MSLKVIKEIYSADGLGEAKKAFSELGNPLDTFTGKATIATAATYTLYKAIQYLSDKYNLSYDSAIKNTEESFSNFSSTKTEVEDLKSQVDTAKDSLTSMADTYNIEIDGTESITELIDKLKSSDLSLEDRAQVSQIEQENASIERQIALKEKLLEYQQKEAASNAMDTMGRGEQSVAQQVAQNVPGGKRTYQGMVDNVGVVDAVKEDVKAIKDYEDKIAELEKKQAGFDVGSKKWKQAEEDINSYNKAIQTLTSDLDSKQADLTTLLKSFSADGEGTTALSGYEEQFNAIKDALNSINNIDLSPDEQALANLQSYFDGSTGKNAIKDQLQKAYEEGRNLETELNRMGLSLDDLGIDNISQLSSYFKDTAKATEEATKSVQDYAASVSDVEKATSSENQDKNWSTISDAYKSAKELLKEGKTGTDDFQSVASFLNPKKVKEYADKGGKYTADAYQKAFEDIKTTANRWFGEDETKSMENFVNDFKKKGLFNVSTDDMGLWDISTNFKTTAEAANQFGISVEAVETMLRGLEAYGYDFSNITFSSEGIKEYETALSGIKSIYDSLGEGNAKERLGKLIEGWDAEYAKYQDDLDSLSEEQIVRIKFEYDLATIQQQIDQLQAKAEEGGDTQTWAELNATKRQYRDKSESREGNNLANVEGYKQVSNTIVALQDQMKGATNEQKEQIQSQISNLYDLQNAINDAFADSGMSWDDFIKTDEYNDAISNMVSSTNDAKQIIADLLGIDVEDIVIDVKAEDNASDVINKVSQEEIEDKIVTLTGVDDATPYINLWNMMSADPKFAELSADDQATLVVETYNKLSIDDKNSLISQTGGEATQGVAAAVKSAINLIPSTKKVTISGSIGATFTNAIASAKAKISSLSGGGGAGLNGTAHLNGSFGGLYPIPTLSGRALAMGTLDDDTWLKSQWKTKNNNVALTGELGQELVVYGNRWWTVGDNGAEFSQIPQGSVVFDANQTKELLSKGFINSRGTANLFGTAYRLGSGSSSSSSKKKSTKKSSSGSSSSKNSAAQAAAKAAEDLFDFVEILLDRTKETTERLTDAIDDAVGLADKMSKNSSALSQIQKEISVNQQAYQKYLAQANAVGLAEGYASQIRNGSLNIENITDENLKKKIEDYRKWYEEAKKCQDTIRDLQKDEKKLALDRLDYIEDYYDSIIKLNEAYQDVNDSRIDLNDAIGNTAIGAEVQSYLKSSYDKQYESYNKALSQLSEYQNEFNNLLSQGYIKEGSEAYYEGQQKIQEFTKQVSDSAVALIELEDKIRAIDYTRLQQIIDGSTRRTDQLKNGQSLAEARDEQIVRDEYQKQIDEIAKNINANYALREAKLQEQNLYDVTSTRYQELADEISKIDGEIYGSLEDIEDLKNKIFETEFFNYEKEQSNLEYYIGELDDFAKLLNSDAYFDKTGAFTDEAYAKISLTADAMSKCKQATANATEALKKLDEMYQNGLISETEYTDKQHDLLDVIRKNISATDDYKKELIDLYKEQMEKSNDALKENIRLRKEALSNAKDYEDFADSLKDKTKTVNELDAQINALQNTNNSQAKAELKRLMAQRADAQKELDNLKKDHTYNLMQDGYDIMSENLDKSLEDISYSIATSSEKQLQVVQSMLSQMVSSYSDAFGKISSIISNTGFVGTGSFNNTTGNIGSSAGSSSIASGATQNQSAIRPSDSASNINSDNISNGQFDSVENEIKKEPNTENRLCAELKISKSSVSVQEGSQTSISASIRPNDAKNKTLSWASADPSIATVSSDGKITGVKPGNTTITVSTTDGSGLIQSCKVTVTKKPEPPKPVVPPSSAISNPQGNGVPDVGDRVTFVSGIYHEDSYGRGRWGKHNLGQSVYITKINPGAPYPIHISTGSRLGSGDRGWLRLDQLRGYSSGSRYIDKRQWAFTDDTSSGRLDAGSEVLITKYGALRQLDAGDVIFSKEQVQKLWEMSKGTFSPMMNLNTSSVFGQLPAIVNRNDMSQKQEVNLNFDSLMSIEGNVSKEAIPGLQKEIDRMIPHISDKLGIFLKGEMRKL